MYVFADVNTPAALRPCCGCSVLPGGEVTTKAGEVLVLTRRSGWIQPRRSRVGAPVAGRVGSTEAGRGGFYRGGLLLMIVLSLALSRFCESYGDVIQCE